jgi:hypothetical protein
MCACVGVYEQCMRVCAYVCAHAQNASQRARQGVRVRVRAERRATCHLRITVHMYSIIGTRARMYTCVRALAECIPACVRGRGRGRARGGSGRPRIVCHFVPFIKMHTYI